MKFTQSDNKLRVVCHPESRPGFGFALPTVLVILTLITFLASSSFLLARSSVENLIVAKSTYKLKSTSIAKALKNTLEINVSGLNCSSTDSSKMGILIQRTICGKYSPDNLNDLQTMLSKGKSPFVDFSKVLAQSFECGNLGSNGYSTKTTFGTYLSDGSIRASKTCQISSLNLLGELTGNFNIELGSLVVEPNSIPTVIAGSGYIDLLSLDARNSKLLVLAGGDLHIQSLQNTSGKLLNITIVSLGGEITIDKSMGDVAILAWAAKGVSVPFTSLSADPVLPPIKGREILGLFQS